jgi:hypothetical protein
MEQLRLAERPMDVRLRVDRLTWDRGQHAYVVTPTHEFVHDMAASQLIATDHIRWIEIGEYEDPHCRDRYAPAATMA